MPDLFVIDLDGPEAPPRLLIEGDVLEDQATFSPDGRTLFFVSTRDGSANIFSIPFRPDRTQPIADAVNLMQNAHPYFSPDGEWIVFTSGMGGINDEEPLVQSFGFAPQMYGELYAYRIADGLLVRLTHDKWRSACRAG